MALCAAGLGAAPLAESAVGKFNNCFGKGEFRRWMGYQGHGVAAERVECTLKRPAPFLASPRNGSVSCDARIVMLVMREDGEASTTS